MRIKFHIVAIVAALTLAPPPGLAETTRPSGRCLRVVIFALDSS
jgi:hypothetical protein